MGMPQIPAPARLPVDAVAYGTAGAALMGYLPTGLAIVASLLSILWLGIQIYAWWEARRAARSKTVS